jgi:cell wall assembly regulator SMI1
MTSSRKKLLLVLSVLAALVVLVVLVAYLAARPALNAFFYPKPRSLPPVVSETTEALLSRLQSILERHAPTVLTSLHPGLSEAEITALEAKGGFRLSDDLRALYRWRKGSSTNDPSGFIPGHLFPPLETIAEDRTASRTEAKSTTFLQRAAYRVFAGHRDDWVEVLPDGAGDGYFFDPRRTEKEGPFFYNLAEAFYYQYFPSFRNFLAGVIECYDKGAYRIAKDGKDLEEDSELTATILKRYGTHNLDEP